MKELVLVCFGSFFGGGARYLVGKAVHTWGGRLVSLGNDDSNVMPLFSLKMRNC